MIPLHLVNTCEKCMEFCLEDANECDKDNSSVFKQCKDSIIDDSKNLNPEEICLKKSEIKNDMGPILDSDGFRELIKFFTRFIKYIYASRSVNGNIYDRLIILSLATIDFKDLFQLDDDILEKIEFPGDGSFQLGMPTNLKEYIYLLKFLLNGSDPEKIKDKFNTFLSDFEPWTNMLITFTQIHSIKLFELSIPSKREKIKVEEFIKTTSKNDLLQLEIHLKSDTPQDIIQYIFTDIKIQLFGKKRMVHKKKGKSKKNKRSKNKKRSIRYKNKV